MAIEDDDGLKSMAVDLDLRPYWERLTVDSRAS
jgi:hypothetical protein